MHDCVLNGYTHTHCMYTGTFEERYEHHQAKKRRLADADPSTTHSDINNEQSEMNYPS